MNNPQQIHKSYKATVDGFRFEVPIDKEGQLVLPEIKDGEIICSIKKDKCCGKDFCLAGCHDSLEKLIGKRIVEQRKKVLID